jgi:hypothetical protein
MSRRIPALGIAVLGVAALAVPATASAATLSVNQSCYTHYLNQKAGAPLSDPIVVSVTGGTPGADFQVAATVPGKGTGSAGSATGTFDAAGNGTAQITDVFPPNITIGPTKGQAVQLSVQDFGTANAGAGQLDVPVGQTLITTLAMNVSTKPSSPRAHRLVSVSGTAFAGQNIYAFIVKGSSTHVLKRISLGKANICGYASTKAVVAPTNYHTGSYRLYINAGKKLTKSKAIYSSFRIYTRSF